MMRVLLIAAAVLVALIAVYDPVQFIFLNPHPKNALHIGHHVFFAALLATAMFLILRDLRKEVSANE